MQKLKMNTFQRKLSNSFIFGAFVGTVFASFFIFSIKYVQEDALLMSLASSPRTASFFVTQKRDAERSVNNGGLENVDDGSIYDDVKILCWVMTQPSNHLLKAIHVKETWGKRCNKLIFISTDYDENLDIVTVNVTEDRDHLWGKTKKAFEHIYENYLDEYDWFLKADDDTYVIMQNLRYFLYEYPTEMPIYFGCRFKKGYMSGGSGYVLSRESVRRLIELGLPDSEKCSGDNTGTEDWTLGYCLHNVGVLAGDARDEFKRGRFFPFPPEGHLRNIYGNDTWFDNATYYEVKTGYECCSESVITFHYITGGQMYVMEYLLYHVQIFGSANFKQLPAKLKVNEVYAKMNKSVPIK